MPPVFPVQNLNRQIFLSHSMLKCVAQLHCCKNKNTKTAEWLQMPFFVHDCCLVNLAPMHHSCFYIFVSRKAISCTTVCQSVWEDKSALPVCETEWKKQGSVSGEYKAIKRIKPDSQHLSSRISTFPGFSISEQNKIKGLYSLSQALCSLWNEWRLNR